MQAGAHSAHNPPGRAPGPRRALVSCALLERRLEPFFWRKKDNLWEKSCKNFSAIGVRISENLRNREGPDLGNAKQKRTEREIQSRRGPAPPPP